MSGQFPRNTSAERLADVVAVDGVLLNNEFVSEYVFSFCAVHESRLQ
jgi:hypothetical protein